MYCTSIGLQGRSFQLFLSENKTSLLFRSLIENPGYLKKDDIVCDFGWPMRVMSGTLKSFSSYLIFIYGEKVDALLS